MSTPTPAMTTEVVERDGIHVYSLCGSLSDEAIVTVRQQVSDMLQGEIDTMLVDMQGVKYVSSSGIGMLVSVLKKSNSCGCDLALCGLNSDLRELFSLTRLDKVFNIAADVDSFCSSKK